MGDGIAYLMMTSDEELCSERAKEGNGDLRALLPRVEADGLDIIQDNLDADANEHDKQRLEHHEREVDT